MDAQFLKNINNVAANCHVIYFFKNWASIGVVTSAQANNPSIVFWGKKSNLIIIFNDFSDANN